MLGRGGGSVAIGRYICYIMGYSGGDLCRFILMAHSRWLMLLDVLVTLWGVRHDGSAPGGDMRSRAVWS